MAHFSLLFQFEAPPARTSSLVHTQQVAVKGKGDGEALIHNIQPIIPTVSSVPIGGAHPKVPRTDLPREMFLIFFIGFDIK